MIRIIRIIRIIKFILELFEDRLFELFENKSFEYGSFEHSRGQPYINNSRPEKLINYWWSEVFYDNQNIKLISRGCEIYPRDGYGLIYYFIIRGQLRYIGKTRERSLKWRLTRRQADGTIGYSYSIKRQLLNSFRENSLRIQTKEVELADLDKTEAREINICSKAYKLWNIEHNPSYKTSNRFY